MESLTVSSSLVVPPAMDPPFPKKKKKYRVPNVLVAQGGDGDVEKQKKKENHRLQIVNNNVAKLWRMYFLMD